MRIVYLCPDLGIAPAGPKGSAAHVRGFLRALRALGHDVVLMTPHPDRSLSVGGGIQVPVIPVPRPQIIDGISPSAEPRLQRALGHLWMNVAIERALGDLIRERRPQLVCERYSPFAAAGVITCQKLGVPHVLEVNAPLAWEGAQYRGQALQEAADTLERATFARAASIVTVSEELKRTLVAAGVAATKIVVVPNGVDGDLFCPDGTARREGLNGEIVLGFVGSLKKWHGVALLAAAFRELAADPRFHLLILGDGPEARRVDSLASEFPGRVTRVPAVPHGDVPRYVRGIDIAVAPYPQLDRFYFSPLKVLEYMAVGRAVVASRIGQLTQLIRNGETGLLVPAGDSAALADAIAELAADPDRRRRLGYAAAAEVRKKHLWRHRAAQILELRRAAA